MDSLSQIFPSPTKPVRQTHLWVWPGRVFLTEQNEPSLAQGEGVQGSMSGGAGRREEEREVEGRREGEREREGEKDKKGRREERVG